MLAWADNKVSGEDCLETVHFPVLSPGEGGGRCVLVRVEGSLRHTDCQPPSCSSSDPAPVI